MPSLENTGEPLWRSLEELDGRASSQASGEEFPPGAALPPDKPSRRHFMKLMAAGAGLAGLTSCRWPKENILPYARRPPEIVPGNPISFATSMDVAGRAQGLVVTSYDGRPIKVDGNEQHPNNRGGTDAQAQASILDLYDPDRSKNPIQRQGQRHFDQTWEAFDNFAREHFAKLRQGQGKGLYVLSEASSSPSARDMQTRFTKAFPQARWYEYEPISGDNERAGTALALGQAYRTQYRFDQAAVVVSLDSDFLVSGAAAPGYARDFIRAHTPSSDKNGAMSRLYVIEGSYTNTGAMADNRLSATSGATVQQMNALVAAVAAGLEGPALPPAVVDAVRRQAGTAAPSEFIAAAAKDLLAHRGKGIVIAGHGQPAEVHALVHVLNAALGNVGQTIWYTADPEGGRPDHVKAVSDLVADMQGQRVDTLLILGGNPIYNAPADLHFAEALAAVPTSVHLSLYWDETSQACTWHLPRAHYLEAWGDTRAHDGTYGSAQPLIRPLYDGRSAIELLSALAETPALGGYEIVQRTVRALHAAEMSDEQFEPFWRELLNAGVLPKTQLAAQQPQLQGEAIAGAIQRIQPRKPLGPQNLEVVFREDMKVYDGRFANNGWLQELPDIFTKVSWDNAVLMGPATAEALKVQQGQVIAVQREGGQIVGPAYILPGQAPFSLSIPLGYGRKAAGEVGNGVGFSAYPLRTRGAMHFADGATVRATGRTITFALTQDHWRIDKVGREGTAARLEELVSEMTLTEYQHGHGRGRSEPAEGHGGAAGAHTGVSAARPPQLWNGYEYNSYKWGMAIDMQKCIGCNACTIACQAENNSPVVGRDQVRRGREMQWLRIDRYFRGEVENPAISFQPIFCVHCENAPCESVCPVAATLHDKDGLNLMVYNRCVGTRYCSNNCPYKVRRFNFYHYTLNPPLVRRMQYNPDVTVRSRGVMEKCTYCVQRIQRVKITAKNERRAIRDGEFTTACAQACPTGAIVFGDLNDPNSRVAQLHKDSRSYPLLNEINTRPRSWHMARVRNPASLRGESGGAGESGE